MTHSQITAAGSFPAIDSGSTLLVQRQGDLTYQATFGIHRSVEFFTARAIAPLDVEAASALSLVDFYADSVDEKKTSFPMATHGTAESFAI
jgi:hypothetical protein